MTQDEYDVVVVGGGPAGLQAALTLGRVHRTVLLVDSGSYRNDPAHEMHNFLTRDGTPPADFRAAAHRDLAAYGTVTTRRGAVVAVAPTGDNAAGDGFTVTLASGEQVLGRRLLLATGVRDTLPATPGLEALFGGVVAHCPFCHGHEMAGGHVAVLGSGPHASRMALLVLPIAERVTVLTDGAELDAATADLLAAAGVAVRREAVGRVEAAGDGARVVLVDGSGQEQHEDVAGVLVATTLTQSAPFAEQLGLQLLPSGGIEVDVLGRTSLPGVYAAGDLAHVAALPMAFASVLTAAAAGLVAGSACVADLLAIDHPVPVPA